MHTMMRIRLMAWGISKEAEVSARQYRMPSIRFQWTLLMASISASSAMEWRSLIKDRQIRKVNVLKVWSHVHKRHKTGTTLSVFPRGKTQKSTALFWELHLSWIQRYKSWVASGNTFHSMTFCRSLGHKLIVRLALSRKLLLVSSHALILCRNLHSPRDTLTFTSLSEKGISKSALFMTSKMYL